MHHLVAYINMASHAIEVKTPFNTVNKLYMSTKDSEMVTDFEIIKIMHAFSR